jgi:hypothetical protein
VSHIGVDACWSQVRSITIVGLTRLSSRAHRRRAFRRCLRLFDGDPGGNRRNVHAGLVERLFTKEGVDPAEVQRRELAVAEAAGEAARAVAVTSAYLRVKGIPQPIDPVSNWRNMTQPRALEWWPWPSPLV